MPANVPIDPQPFITVEPRFPCPGDQVTIRGGGFSCQVALLLREIEGLPSGMPNISPVARVGDVPVDRDGRFQFVVDTTSFRPWSERSPRFVLKPTSYYHLDAFPCLGFEEGRPRYDWPHATTYLILCGYFSPAPSRAPL